MRGQNNAHPIAPRSRRHTTTTALWAALSRVADKEANRDDLPAGSAYIVNLLVTGEIDGQPIEQALSAVLTVGHDSTRATSATPAVDRLIGSILAKLNTVTREAILRELPEQFEAAGCVPPEVPADVVEKTAGMLKRLRAKQSQAVRGSVSVKYRLPAAAKPRPRFAVVG